jgi:hypothetical protein
MFIISGLHETTSKMCPRRAVCYGFPNERLAAAAACAQRTCQVIQGFLISAIEALQRETVQERLIDGAAARGFNSRK